MILIFFHTFSLMEYDRYDSGGKDGGLPPSQIGEGSRGPRRSGAHELYGHSVHKLEKDAYRSVLQAFCAQSSVITWRKEQLMATLRQELRISNQQHLDVLMGMDFSRAPQHQFREQDSPKGEHIHGMYASNVDPVPTSTLLSSRKKQKTVHVSLENLPPPTMKPKVPSPTVTRKSPSKRGGPGRARVKGRGGRKSTLGINSGRLSPVAGLISQGNAWLGKRVKIRPPDDDKFYEAIITDYDPEEDLHALLYYMNTESETWEWVDLKLLSNDMQIVEGPLVDVVGKGTPTSGLGNFRRGRAVVRGPKRGGGSGLISPRVRDHPPSKRLLDSFEKSNQEASTPENDSEELRHVRLPPLNALIKQVDQIVEGNDLVKIGSFKNTLKAHEEMLKKALAEVGEFSDDEKENSLSSDTQPMGREEQSSKHADSDEHGDDENNEGNRGEAFSEDSSDENRHNDADGDDG